MKTARIIISMLIACLVLSAWTPAAASAKTQDEQAIFIPGLNSGLESAKMAVLTIDNQTGGSLFITLNPQRFERKKGTRTTLRKYSLLATKQGKTQFQILAGIYVYTIRSSNCGGKKMDTKAFTGETILGPYSCDK